MPLLARVVPPSLTQFLLRGSSKYIDDLVSRIDIPLLDHACMTFFAQLAFDTPRPHDFLARTETSTEHDHAIVQFDSVLKVVSFELRPWSLSLEIKCASPRWQLSLMAQLGEKITRWSMNEIEKMQSDQCQ